MLSPRGHWALSGNIFSCHSSHERGGGVLLAVCQAAPHDKEYLVPNVNGAEGEKPQVKQSGALLLQHSISFALLQG